MDDGKNRGEKAKRVLLYFKFHTIILILFFRSLLDYSLIIIVATFDEDVLFSNYYNQCDTIRVDYYMNYITC